MARKRLFSLTFFFSFRANWKIVQFFSEADVARVFVNSKSWNKNSKFGFTQLLIKNVHHARLSFCGVFNLKAGGKK